METTERVKEELTHTEVKTEIEAGVAERLKEKVKKGGQITKEEALALYRAPLEELCRAADEIREHF